MQAPAPSATPQAQNKNLKASHSQKNDIIGREKLIKGAFTDLAGEVIASPSMPEQPAAEQLSVTVST